MPTIKGTRVGHPEGGYTLGEKKVHRKYIKQIYVRADSHAQGPNAILATPGLPIVGLTVFNHGSESDLAAICKSKKAKRVGSKTLYWLVTAEFDNESNSQAQEDESETSTPVNRPYEIDWDSIVEEITLWKDFSTPPKAIVNSAGERFPEPITGFVAFPTLTITRWESTFTAATILAYVQRVNSTNWLGADPRAVLCESIRASRVLEEGTLLWRVTYQFKFSVLPWKHDANILDQGSYYNYGILKNAFVTDDNVPYIGNLDGTGNAAPAGQFYWLDFKRHAEANFTTLGLV